MSFCNKWMREHLKYDLLIVLVATVYVFYVCVNFYLAVYVY